MTIRELKEALAQISKVDDEREAIIVVKSAPVTIPAKTLKLLRNVFDGLPEDDDVEERSEPIREIRIENNMVRHLEILID